LNQIAVEHAVAPAVADDINDAAVTDGSDDLDCFPGLQFDSDRLPATDIKRRNANVEPAIPVRSL
jgi:hypothetical protein